MNDQKEVSLTFKNAVTGQQELEKYEKQLESIYSLAQGLKSEKASIGKISVSIRNINNETNKTTKSVNMMAKSFNLAFSLRAIAAFGNQLKSLASQFANLTQKSVNYIENVNLLEVAYRNANETIEESSARIENYIDKMSEVYGLDASNLTRQFGVFKQMANAMQLPIETGEQLSELMVKMTNDIASLYNLSLERSSNALQSALVGQTRPIRGATGADITEKTLQNTVDRLGLDKSISDLSYVEKRLIMVVSLTQQLKVSQGDYARTIESASNQIRIMHEQWNALSRAVGNIFYGVLQQVMPYVNGLLMALTEIANIIADLLGFEMPTFDYSSLAPANDYLLDMEDNMGGIGDNATKAGKAVDTLAKKMSGLRSFDALNVINTPSSSSAGAGGVGGGSKGGSGSGFGGKIDPKILNAFKDAFSNYNDLMDSVKLKAHDIRDTILEWLGFHKVIDGLTGETKWKYGGIDKTLHNVWKSVKKLPAPVKAIMGAIATFEIAKFIKHLKGIKDLLSESGILGFVKSFFTPLKTLKSSFVEAFNSTKNSGMGVANTLTSINKGFTNWAKNISTVDALKVSIATVTSGFLLFKDALKDAGDMTTGTFLKMEAGIASMQFGFATIASNLANSNEQLANFQLLGSSVGELAGPIGMLVGSFVGLFSAIKSGLDGQAAAYATTTEAGEAYRKSLDDIRASVNESITLGMAHISYCQDLQEELLGLVDANGKVKKGNEERVQQIVGVLNKTLGTQLSVEGNVIKSGKDQIKNQEQLQKEIQKTIQQKKLEIAVNATQAQYEKTLAKQMELQGEITRKTKVLEQTEEELDSIRDSNSWADRKRKKELEESIERQKKGLKNLQEQVDGYGKETQGYQRIMEASITGNVAAVDKELKLLGIDMGLELDKSADKTTKVLDGSVSKAKTNADKMKEEIKKKFLNWTLPSAKVTATIQSPTGNQIDKFSKDFNAGLQKYGFTFGKLPGAKAEGGMYKNGQWSPITNYATGGIPRVGQMFVAREAGPELVGKIGNGTAVMNNNQIVDSVASGVYRAVVTANKTNGGGSGGTQVYNIYLDKNNKLATYTLEQLQQMATTNGKPIRIGG